MATESSTSSLLSWAVYLLFLILRVVIASVLPGYLHPDEFFQGGQELFFGNPSIVLPWEFTSAIRSIVPPTIMTYLPLRLYRMLTMGDQEYSLTGWEVLVIPRLMCGVLSILAVDASVYYLTTTNSTNIAHVTRTNAKPTSAQWIIQTSWPVWVILSRPFSNGLETMCLALLLLLVWRQRRASPDALSSRRVLDALALGTICSIGFFARFTFIFFSIPAMLFYLWQKRSAVLDVFICALGFVVTSRLIVAADASYYGYLVVTPWNALRYNSQVSNLQQHGLHPHWTHAVVNMMLLFGPMTIIFYYETFTGMSWSRRIKPVAATDDNISDEDMHHVYIWTVISGLTFLSMAPHQEPRFLAPLVVPLAILMGKYSKLWTNLKVQFIWIAFNTILLLVFGVLHQGGVVPSLLSSVDFINQQQGVPSYLLFHKTYMPPSFLTRQQRRLCDEQVCLAKNDAFPTLEVIDLQGDYELKDMLNLYCDNSTTIQYLQLVAPPHTIDANLLRSYEIEAKWTYWPHLTTEDFPLLKSSLSEFISSFRLTMYSVKCLE